MNEIVRRNRERLQALPSRQIWIEATVNVVVVSMVSFCFSHSFRHTLEATAVSLVLNLLWSYWLRQSQDLELKRPARRRRRRQAHAPQDNGQEIR